MGMTLYVKRSKSFVHQEDDGGTRKFLAPAGSEPVNNVPFWVASTATFKNGVKDKSIVNLTPPHLMPGYKFPDAPAPVPDEPEEPRGPQPGQREGEKDDPIPAEVEDADEAEQAEVPKQPFGGQPMGAVTQGLQGSRGKKR